MNQTPNSETHAPTPRQAAFCRAAADLLRTTFQEPFEMWLPSGGWRRLVATGGQTADAAHDDATRVGFCTAIAERPLPDVHRLTADRCLLGIPIAVAGELKAVAIREFATNSPQLALQLAEAFLHRWAQEEKVRGLTEENSSLAEQISEDFEELMFLRSLAENLDISNAGAKLETIARNVLPLLNQSVAAEWLAFVAADRDGQAVAELVAADGADFRNFDVVRKIIDDFRDEVLAQPVVRNRVHSTGGHWRYPGVREFVLVPAATDSKMIGWLVAINRQFVDRESLWQLSQLEFGSHEASLMATTATIVATQASNIELLREKEGLLVSVARALVTAIEAKDEYTRGHSERVALYSRRLGSQLGYTPAEADRLYLAALLHDIGKIGICDATLKKPGKLTEEEFREIQAHPEKGWEILQGIEPLAYVIPGMLQHHERIDGRGYPDGLEGEEISLDSRIMAVADAFDAMTSDRPYRKGMPLEKAEAILREGAGSQWDSGVVDAFFEVRDEIFEIRRDFIPAQRPVRDRTAPAHPGCRTATPTQEPSLAKLPG
jgi:HD-GYP domain-containing protein (c-di-GMP phosphodiesterase class II)